MDEVHFLPVSRQYVTLISWKDLVEIDGSISWFLYVSCILGVVMPQTKVASLQVRKRLSFRTLAPLIRTVQRDFLVGVNYREDPFRGNRGQKTIRENVTRRML